MNEKKFDTMYKHIKKIIENIDPAGFGAKGEYDDVIFKIIKDINLDKNILSDLICKNIAGQFGLNESNIKNSCNKVAEEILNLINK